MLLLMYGIVLLNYLTALTLDYCQNKIVNARKKYLLRLGTVLICLTICLGLLWYFKYWTFSVKVFNKIALLFHSAYKLSVADKIVLPLGISFYTFHCLSYTFDVYHQKMKADKNLLNFMCYVLMFPQLVAGPIVRYIDIQKQFKKRHTSLIGFANGIRRFCFGLAKKVLIANTVAQSTDAVFALNANELAFSTAWLGAICYTLQIYFDFSGYSDMAIGLAALFGFKYKENFNYPYISKTAGEFWRRWHISLSTWLRDYVYIYMGGNRVAKWHYYSNILIVFLLSGLWHGANFTFVLWGLWYGIFICLESCYLKKFLQNKPYLAHFYTLFLIIFGWVMFRSVSVKYAAKYWGAMLGKNGFDILDFLCYSQNDVYLAVVFGIIFSVDWRPLYKKLVIGNSYCPKQFLTYKIAGYGIAIILYVVCVASIFSSAYNPFIYFRF
ncbi:MAG: MBOAT family protein [Phascolarctobacterium sp.]|nr:MBOAT family protein [Candidatus Phascolarctobacterium caballi]